MPHALPYPKQSNKKLPQTKGIKSQDPQLSRKSYGCFLSAKEDDKFSGLQSKHTNFLGGAELVGADIVTDFFDASFQWMAVLQASRYISCILFFPNLEKITSCLECAFF